MPRSLTPTSASALASSTSLVMLSTCRSLSPRDTKSRSRRMIWPARSAWSAALSSASRIMPDVSSALAFEQPARALQIVGDRRQRLVEFMRQRRGHLAHRGQPRDMDQFGLQLLQARLGLLALGQVADEAGEKALLAGSHLADRQLHRKGRAVLALADHDAADADDAPLAGAQ